MAQLNTVSLSVFTELAENIFEKGLTSVMNSMRESGLVKVTPIPQGTGNSRQFTEIDLEEYASNKDESDQSSVATAQQGYTKVMTSKRVAKDIDISYEMRTQNKNQEVMDRLTNLAKLAPNRQDLDLSHRLTFGTATSYTDKDGATVATTVGDGLALFSTAHTLTGSSTTFRNILANNPQISKGALEGMEKLIVEETYNNLGEKMAMTYDVLWTTDDPNTVNTVKEYLQSTADITGSNSGVTNVYKAKYRHAILPRVATTAAGAIDTTKRKYWGIASSSNSSFHLGVWEEPRLKSPSAGNNGEDFSTDDWTYGVRAGYGIATVGARAIKFSAGDGSA